MMSEFKRAKLNGSGRPDDVPFETMSGCGPEELCRATGYQVFDEGEWWYEYADHNGDYHYCLAFPY